MEFPISFQNLSRSQLKRYVWLLCNLSGKYSDKHVAINALDNHLGRLSKKLKSNSSNDIENLKNKINKVIQSEKKIIRYQNIETEEERLLRKRIVNLEAFV